MFRRLFFCLCLTAALPAAAAEIPPRQLLADNLLILGGTAAVFDSPAVQAALADPQPFLGEAGLPRFERLFAESGLRRWQPPRLWVLQWQGAAGQERWTNLLPALEREAERRGYRLVGAEPLPSAVESFGFLQPGRNHPGLRGLLAAYEADALVLIRGGSWTLWQPSGSRQGVLPEGVALQADLLAEVAAAEQQWPEARDRAVIQVDGVSGLADFAGIQAALQALPGARQVQLLRAEPGRLWFALAAPAGDALQAALGAEPRLPAVKAVTGLPPRLLQARRLGCPLLSRHWQADALPNPPAPSVQSAPTP
ncbi:MAG TPA: hypothetical protein VF050_11065 [Moraxellaceae bacterium]